MTLGKTQAPGQQHIRAMFDQIVDRYDVLNTILSLGLDRRWRVATLEAAHIAAGDRVLDLGCGTGDLVLLAARATPGGRGASPGSATHNRSPVGLDVSLPMLSAARRKAGRAPRPVLLVQGSTFRLPFANGAFDAVVSAFVLRNLDDLIAAFSEIHRVTAPGGRIALLDITVPRNPILRRVFDTYFGTVAPALGGLVGKRDAYRYLVRSLAHLPPPADVCRLLERSGFASSAATPLTWGTVTLFTATRRRMSRESGGSDA